MADIERGQIDIVVVYKIDRLTRSLADFSKMVEVFERHGVSFVSVTQQFNTTTSMGRLMLNVLLSFAQFEREVTGERIRDKIAASQAQRDVDGWRAALGYDVENRLLVINDTEAAVVRRIFEEMLTIGSPTQIAANLTWMASPPRPGRRRRARPQRHAHRQEVPAQAAAQPHLPGGVVAQGKLVPRRCTRRSSIQELWDGFTRCWPRTATPGRWKPRSGRAPTPCCAACCTRPRASGCTRPTRARTGASTTTTCPSRKARFGAPGKSYERLPAPEIEAAVVAQIRTVLTSPESIASVVRHIQRNGARSTRPPR
jgi:site-specific DNA recombinase